MTTIPTKPYLEQLEEWPIAGQHIMAHYDREHIVVYQAYRPEIGNYATQNNRFGGAFSYNRMSWIKPNFLWMMYRSGWGTKAGQEVVLAVTLKRSFFDEILSQAVASTYDSTQYGSHEEWKTAVADSDVRLQWDPDHAPDGATVERRAVQLGLRGEILSRFGQEEIIHIEDISNFVEEQRENMRENNHLLITPYEHTYLPPSDFSAKHIQSKF